MIIEEIVNFHNLDTAFVQRPRAFIAALLLLSFLPYEMLMVGPLDITGSRLIVYLGVNTYASVCYFFFLFLCALVFGLRAVSVSGFSMMAAWSVVAFLTRTDESRLLTSLSVASSSMLFQIRLLLLFVFKKQLRNPLPWRSRLWLGLVAVIGTAFGIALPLVKPEWCPIIHCAISVAEAILLSRAFSINAEPNVCLQFRDWAFMGGGMVILGAHTCLLSRSSSRTNRSFQPADLLIYFSICITYFLSFFWDMRWGRFEVWKTRKERILAPWRREATEKERFEDPMFVTTVV